MKNRNSRLPACRRALLALMLACLLTGQVGTCGALHGYRAAPKAGAKTPPVQVGHLFRVEVQVADERFKGVTFPAPPVSVSLLLDPKRGDRPTEARELKVEVKDRALRSLYQEGPKVTWEDGTKTIRVALVARVVQLDVQFGRRGGEKLPEKAALATVEFQSANGTWNAVPAEAYRWTASGRDRGTLALVPAALQPGKASQRLRLTADGCLAEDVPMGGKPKPVTLKASPVLPALPRKWADKYRHLQGQGWLQSIATYYRMKTLPDYSFYVVPGFIPIFARQNGRKQIELWQWDRERQDEDPFLPFGRWPRDQPEPGKLLLSVAVGPLPEFKWSPKSPPGGKVALVVFGDRELASAPLIASRGGPLTASFLLPELYDKVAKLAKDRGVSALSGFEELETRARVRFIPKKPEVPSFYRVEKDKRFAADARPNFGLSDSWRLSGESTSFPQVHARQVELTLRPVKCEALLEPPPGRGWDPSKLTFSAWHPRKKNWVPLDPHAAPYLLNRATKMVVFLPAWLESAGLSTRVRADLPPKYSAEVTLEPGRTPRFVFRLGELTVILPRDLKPAQAPLLIFTAARDAKPKFLKLDALKPEQSLRREDIGEGVEGGHVELRVGGYKPLVIPKLTGSTVDGGALEKVGGQKFLLVVNDWAHIVSPSDVVRTNIGEVQKEVCKSLVEQAGKEKNRVAGFALVTSREAAWPPGVTDRGFLFTGEKPPLPKKDRRDRASPDGVWKELRTLLMHPEVAGQHDSLRLVLVTPYQRSFKKDEEGEDKKWVLDRIKMCQLRFHTVVIGGPDARTADLDKVYIQPSFLKVSKEGIDYGRGKIEMLDPLPAWLKEKVLSR
jgi:hypothetical protein